MLQTFVNEKTGQYYIIPLQDDCVSCQECRKVIEIEDWAFIHKNWTRKGLQKTMYCANCVKKRTDAIFTELTVAQVLTDYPDNSTAIIDTPPPIKNGKLDSFDAANLESDTETDHTIYAGKNSFKGAKIGMEQTEELERNRLKNLTFKEFKKELGLIGNAKLDTPKQIKHKEEGK